MSLREELKEKYNIDFMPEFGMFSAVPCIEELKILLDLERQAKEELSRDYYQLLYAVENKYPDETRHQTALRLIIESQRTKDINAGQLIAKHTEKDKDR